MPEMINPACTQTDTLSHIMVGMRPRESGGGGCRLGDYSMGVKRGGGGWGEGH